MASKREILITVPFSAEALERIKAVSPQIEVTSTTLDGQWPEERTTKAEVIYTTGTVPPLELAPNLRWAHSHWAGVEQFVGSPLWNSEVAITNTSGIHAPNMGQYTMAMILAWANRVPAWIRQQQEGQWPARRREQFTSDELRGRTLGIIGYGSIGREIARLATTFGMEILVTKRDARRVNDEGYNLPGYGDPTGDLPRRIYPPEATHSMVGECDYIVITLPLTTSTHHMFDEAMFRAMKPTCFVVNVGRGGIIKEPDLIRALQKGWIAGAGLDVFEEEPLPEDSPLWGLENAIISPHVSGFTNAYEERAVDLFVTNLERYLAGQSLLNAVNRETEY
ncbi:MAG: D-2-hydroxyacid dehydrogenase [Chloroflexota bacterium]